MKSRGSKSVGSTLVVTTRTNAKIEWFHSSDRARLNLSASFSPAVLGKVVPDFLNFDGYLGYDRGMPM